ncbi:sigma-70 family RNA polymerase sigma factor [Flaviaesturariibacter flavus]|uniref:Sigma-70 family RNA polymerase sigma factor n=1 Tax=Flaviaesturariibacter flavus TaxID=2502780 RepID=A0A4R1BC82_9BACT|nr:sigma-70 family RNA polymerase sigma factor [Flaviaesturariibacter flavus]TCJ14604.1 sigma-70 family RNA polymerase sigma factor [Flaviaesturariibacter flavus]
MKEVLSEIAALTDNEVLQRVLQGELALFEILIRRYNPVLYKIARSYDFNHQDAEDLMQETHVAAYQHLGSFEGRSSYKTWVSRIMINKCLYKLRYGAHRRETFVEQFPETLQPIPMKPAPGQPEQRVVNKELSVILEKSLQQVPVIYRTVFVLREIEGLSVAETADILGVTAGNVKVRLSRAKVLLQQQIGQVYSRAEIYSFNLVYCDAIVEKVFDRIRKAAE